MKKKIVLAGGSGFLGEKLANYLVERNYKVVILTRNKKEMRNQVSYVEWDGQTLGNWVTEINGSYAIVNFTGKSVDCIYTSKNKEEILNSRIHSVEVLQKAILHSEQPPKVFIQAGSLAIYGNTKKESDETAEHGKGFSVEVCQKWEKQFYEVDLPHTRKILYRIGFVLGEDGGALEPLKKLVSFHLGGTVGAGTQYISWLHIDDCNEMFLKAIEDNEYVGTFNATSPKAVTNKEFMTTLRQVMGKGWGMPAPSPLVWFGAYFLLKTEPSLALTGRNCSPKKLMQKGFVFKYENLTLALKNTI
ncbi:TIGR01777 family oxidoreductase [Metabacillus litoralis]|uniref:TIGR01777 family oxidoreductase n=1 Tax=Metabacillus litoralis TaxID=152268 RepID=UPI001CFC6228|nr:TIGR01777 family oxidoreductase [Metabacillus litoralis]